MYSENYSRQTAIAGAEKALDPNLTDHELAAMARSNEAKVRATVAERPETPLTALLRLAEDEAPAVRAGVARNPRRDMPEEVHLALMKDKSHEVVHALIKNPSVPDRVIAKLTRSRHKDYMVAARERLNGKGGAKAKMLGLVGFATS
jgi:hypothetical protein